jgi:predicted transcriptional regulator
MPWEDAAFVLKSSKRKQVLIFLETPKTPTQLAKAMKSSLPNISLKLGDLTKRGLVVCINPHDGKGRIYTLTDKGKEVLKAIKSMES